MVNRLIATYRTRDPFNLASCLDITVLYEDLGSIKGYYNSISTVVGTLKFIHVNKSISDVEKRIVAAHELGHAVLHPEISTPFMRANTYYSINKFEIEANTFAVNLLISDDEILDNLHFTVDQMAAFFGVPEILMDLRLKSFTFPKNLNHSEY